MPKTEWKPGSCKVSGESENILFNIFNANHWPFAVDIKYHIH